MKIFVQRYNFGLCTFLPLRSFFRRFELVVPWALIFAIHKVWQTERQMDWRLNDRQVPALTGILVLIKQSHKFTCTILLNTWIREIYCQVYQTMETEISLYLNKIMQTYCLVYYLMTELGRNTVRLSLQDLSHSMDRSQNQAIQRCTCISISVEPLGFFDRVIPLIRIWASSWDYGAYHIATSEGSGEPAHLRSLARAFAFTHIKYGNRRRVRPNISHLAPLDGCACMFEEWVYGGRKVP